MSLYVRSERGSLPLVLLAAIAIGGVVIALFLTVRSGIDSSGRDRDFAAAVQVADAGLQDAFVELELAGEDGIPPCDTAGTGECTGTLQDGSDFTWSYEQTGQRMWTVTSFGEFGGSTRVLQAEVGERPLFGAAIVTDLRFDYNGGGTGTEPFPVGGFQEMRFTGNTGRDYISTLFLYSDDNVPSGPGAPEEDKWERTEGPALPNIAAAEFNEPGGECYGTTTSDTITSPLSSGVYCLTGQLDLRNDLVLDIDETLPEDEQPVRIYVQRGGMSVGPRTVNNPGDAVNLQIYVGEGDVVMNGNFRVTAAIYAPNSACTSNGQGGGGFAGGIICNTVTLNGNMRYDPTIDQIMDDTFAIRGWREEPQLSRQAASGD